MQGLSISLVGLLITFFALGVFIILMVILKRIFPAKPKAEDEEEQGEPVIRIDLDQPDENEAVVAAIAAAVSYFQAESRPLLGANLETGHGRWWVANRSALHRISSLKKK